ncbi:FAD-dependent oxidoreductase [Streptomyces sp. NPDC001027]|uniref:NAD(P)/FAD-dependent oxidoreductase n=1 Tax=Streptomyces sp. NPDC001027 TaxID=3154771 RepID=UPI003321EBF4
MSVTSFRAADGQTVVVVGAGQGGFQAACSLRDAGHTGRIVVVGDEPGLPYQRPPLSKAYLRDPHTPVLLRGEDFFTAKRIDLRDGTRVRAIHRSDHTVELADGELLAYDQLVIATGARPRHLPVPGAGLDGVMELRTLPDAEAFRARLAGSRDVVVVGGGFVGMEIAATVSAEGHRVAVVESLDRPMARAVSPEVSIHLAQVHRKHGVQVLMGRAVESVADDGAGGVSAVVLRDGTRLSADVVLVGIGAVPNSELARDAGLAICPVTGGVVVDEHLVTSDPAISAIGDCATYPSVHAELPVRLESVQNAVDHARHVAARMVNGVSARYGKVPWFWSHQYDVKLQIAGLADAPSADDATVVFGDPATGSFSVGRYRGDRLVAVESVNRAADHMAARKVLAEGARPTRAEAQQPGFDLREYLRAR